jgi:hypothetical protein
MQRVRVGLTGLAFVFLLVMLATALLRVADSTESGAVTAGPVVNAAAPAEPLAQLGVAPGNPQSQRDQAPASNQTGAAAPAR